MRFFSIFNFIYKLFSKRGLRSLLITFFILVVSFLFTSNVFASTTSFDLDLSDFNVSEPLHVDFTGTDYTLEQYPYIYIIKRDSVFQVYFCKIPLYYYSSYDYENNTYYNFQCSTLNTDIIYNFYSLNNDAYEMYNSFSNSPTATYSSAYVGLVSNEPIYTDSSLTTQYTGFNYIVNGTVVESGGSTGGDVNNNVNTNTIDYSDVLGHIDNQVTSTNTIVDNIDNTTQSIDNRVYQIQVILENQNQNEVTNAITSTACTTQNMINNTSAQTQNQIEQSRVQSQTQFNTITNTSTYDNSVAFIDTSAYQVDDVNHIDTFISTIYSTIYNFFNDLDVTNSVEIVIPLPFTDKSMTLSTASLQRFYAQHTVLSNLITIFWYFAIGVYIFRIAYSLFIASATGELLRSTDGLTAYLDDNNLVKYLML